jgi:phosphoglycolate phosphatase
MINSIKLIIFDLDGTLVDSLADLTAAVNRMLQHLGRAPVDKDAVRGMVGKGARNLVERALTGASSAEIDDGLRLFLAFNEENLADHTLLYPGVVETLERLQMAGRQFAVVSNKNTRHCRMLLERLQVDRFFPAVLGADSVPTIKPSPEPLLAVMRASAVSAAETVMVGDSINDIAAGKGAGVVTVGCSWGYGRPAELAEADYRIDTFAALAALPFLHRPR